MLDLSLRCFSNLAFVQRHSCNGTGEPRRERKRGKRKALSFFLLLVVEEEEGAEYPVAKETERVSDDVTTKSNKGLEVLLYAAVEVGRENRCDQ